MGRFNGEGRDKGPDRRRDAKGRRRGGMLHVESLEQRALLDGSDPIRFQPTNNNLADVQNGPLAIAGPNLVQLYQEHQNYLHVAVGDTEFESTLKDSLRIEGEYVGVTVRVGGDLETATNTFRNIGMQVEATLGSPKLVEGLLPIAQLPTLAGIEQAISIRPIQRVRTDSQGSANNQAEASLRVDVARNQFGVNGAGVTVGVISDSASQLNGGLQDSVNSGDLPSSVLQPGTILQDGPAGSSDEGRAMMELIHDLAPGSRLLFATGFVGPAAFANNIRALAAAGARVIVDDLSVGSEPFFQDGVISQAITEVTRNSGVVYLTSAGNAGNHGYQSPAFGFSNATVGGVAGRFMDFDPGNGVVTQLPITLDAVTDIVFQYDQAVDRVTSDVNILFLDANGTIVAQGNANNLGTLTPSEFVTDIPTTAVSMAVQVVSGPDIGLIRVRDFGTQSSFNATTQYAATPGVSFVTNAGNKGGAETLAVGTVNWFSAPPTANPNPLANADYSSFGPVTIVFDAQGNRLPTPQTRLKPEFSSIDGVNTSFFGSPPGSVPPGLGANNYALPNFYGTSAAAPNAAAVAALMKQLNPGASFEEIRAGLIASGRPLNGAAQGAHDRQGGFGLIDATAALNAVDQFRVSATSPGSGEVLSSTAQGVLVVFNRPVNAATISPSDLQFIGAPAGVSVQVIGAFVDPNNPNVVAFPIQINKAPGVVANGSYTFQIADGAVLSTDGKTLIGTTSSFTIADQIAPRITNTQLIGRRILISFSEPMDPATITLGNIHLLRAGNGTPGLDPNTLSYPINVGLDPRTRISYDPGQNVATLDLSDLPQVQLPSDYYQIVVNPQVTDAIGLPLDGEFGGNFPSGNGTSGGQFAQSLGLLQLQPPQITSLALDLGSDSGLQGDRNTLTVQPTFVGQVASSFPGSLSGLQVLVEFNGLTPGNVFSLGVGGGGRGYVGNFQVETITDANGAFRFQAPGPLPDGLNQIRVVVVGQPDAPPLPGLSTSIDQAFRIDTTKPLVDRANVSPSDGQTVNALTVVSLPVVDPMRPTAFGDPLAVPTQLSFPALDPNAVSNLSNYRLINENLGIDFSSRIRGAQFISTNNRGNTFDPYTGTIQLTFEGSLPAGRYLLILKSFDGVNGLRDAAGNPLDGDFFTAGIQDFITSINVQTEAVYVRNYFAVTPTSGSPIATGPRSFYELPAFGAISRAEAPPREIVIDFSNPLNPSTVNNDTIQLIRSANGSGQAFDGDFGDFGIRNTTGFFRVQGTTVSLVSSNPAATGVSDRGWMDRLVLTLPANLEPDNYRVYIPNAAAVSGVQGVPDRPSTILRDVFGSQLDGEFLGNPTSNSMVYENFLPNGLYRQGLSGDLVAGGAFVTGFTVVPNGNIIYARPDYIDDPFLSGDDPDGSLAKPFPTLAPEAANNNSSNFGSGFNRLNDRNGNGVFDRSAFLAAASRSALGPVVVVALPGVPQRNPSTGIVSQQTFVMAPPAGVLDASASVPDFTTLVLEAGATLKMQSATLFVQNQGTALQLRGSLNSKATITSYFDDTVGGDTNRDGSDTLPRAGDFGGLALRNYDDVSARPVVGTGGTRRTFPVDGTLGLSGADDVMSTINFADIRYGGGAVPRTSGTLYDSITLYNSRPAISNTTIGVNNRAGSGASQASISGDFDSFREDDVARGVLVRRTTVANHSLNGIWVRPESNGIASASDAILYADNLPGRGSARNFTFDDPLPYLLTSRLFIGEGFIQNSGGQTETITNRLYVQPGMIVKSRRGAGIDSRKNFSFIDPQEGGSLIIGDRTYIDGFDADPNYAPLLANGQPNPNFRANTVGDAKVIFTSLSDTAATTFFVDPNVVDPVTQQPQRRTIVPSISSDNGALPQPTPGNIDPLVRWGNVSILSGTVAVIDEAEFRYGGGLVNLPGSSLPSQPVLNLIGGATTIDARYGDFYRTTNEGQRVSITNSDFFDSLDAPIAIDPNGLGDGDGLRPLLSGNPFFRGNIFQRNGVDGLAVLGAVTYDAGGAIESAFDTNPFANVTRNSIWDDNDLVYVVRGTISVAGWDTFFFGQNIGQAPIPNYNQLDAERRPAVTLTVQSTLPGTILANGEEVGRPGESPIIKMLNQYAVQNATSLDTPGTSTLHDRQVGAGFIVGVDDGIDPPAAGGALPDEGWGSQIRFVGIGSNETTGQTRVPVILTSLRDTTVGRTIRGVTMNQTLFQPLSRYVSSDGSALVGDAVTPSAGDAGSIYFGGMMQTDYNLFDPRGGSIIDNADLKFLTRIELQGGGIFDAADLNADNSINLDDAWRNQKLGTLNPRNQFNSSIAMTISNSNLSNFSSAGVFVHPGFDALVRTLPLQQPQPGAFLPITRVGGLRGLGVDLFLYNNVLANMPIGVRVNAETGDNTTGQTPMQVILLNNTFYNMRQPDTADPDTVAAAFQTVAPNFNGQNSLSHVYYLAMNNIFSNPSLPQTASAAIDSTGMVWDSQAQYNLFHNFQQQVLLTGTSGFSGNFGATTGDPLFRDPANGNFFLRSGSPAIDRSRSEIGPYQLGNMLLPVSNQVLSQVGGIRNTVGRSNGFGGLTFFTATSADVIALPGTGFRDYFDQFIPVLQTDPSGSIGSSGNAGTYPYAPIGGVRDLFGFLRQDDPTTPNVEFGSLPFLDLGAVEFRELFAPRVVAFPDDNRVVRATTPQQVFDLYRVGGISGVNQSPQSIQIVFDRRIDPNSINGRTVRLQASGGDGIFGNSNSAGDRFIDLGGRVSIDSATERVLTILLSTAGLTLESDVYRIVLVGDGSEVIRDQQGNALDGENLDGSGLQLPVPSGDGFPGGSFQVTFSVDTSAPSLVGGSFRLDPASDTNRAGDRITSLSQPGFIGRVTDAFPPANPLQGQTVFLEIFNPATGQFEAYGSAQTDATGNFRVVPNRPIPNTPYNVGPDGILGTADDTGYSLARAYAVDQSGNRSTNELFETFVVDTRAPQVVGFSPSANQVAPVENGRVRLAATFDENIDLASINANSITVIRSGGDGDFANGGEVTETIDPSTISVRLLFDAQGSMEISFLVSGTAQNDQYLVILRGTGANAVRDIAGNPLGRDVDSQFLVFNPEASIRRYVLAGFAGGTGTLGSRSNPYPTITAALNDALTGDIVAVLPGIYNESITLRSFVQVVSADFSSDDSINLPGDPLSTIIRPAFGSPTGAAVTGTNLQSVDQLPTRLSGLTIASPLLFNPAVGILDTNSIGLDLINSDILVDKNYFVDSGVGIRVTVSGAGAATPRLLSNAVIGNSNGLQVIDSGASSVVRPVQFYNNTVAFNDVGAFVAANAGSPVLVDIANSIFWQNHTITADRAGAAISASVPDKTLVRFNLFSGNGPLQGASADDVVNVGLGFDPTRLGAIPDALGNFVGDPDFVAPRDPRPGSDGPGVFFLESNFDLAPASAAIDNALQALAPATDIRNRGRVDFPGIGLAGRGPADLGAFEHRGTGGLAAGGAFRVASTSISGGRERFGTDSLNPLSIPNQIVVIFANRVDAASVTPSDLVITGSGLDPANPARAVSLSWIDDQTVAFNIAGGYSRNGTINVSIANGSVRAQNGELLRGYSDTIQILDPTVTANPVPAPVPAPTPAPTAGPTNSRAARQAAARKAAAQRAAQKAAARKAAQEAARLRRASAARRPALATR